MRTRVKVVALSAACVLVATLLISLLMVRHLRSSFEGEVENRARSLLAAFSVPCVCALASNRVEDLDWLAAEFRHRMKSSADVADVAVLDRRLRVLAHTDIAMYGRILDDPFSVEAGESSQAVVRVEGEGRARVMRASAPLDTSLGDLPGLRWGTLTATLRMSKVDEKLDGILLESLKLIAILAVLSGLLLLIVSDRMLIRPIARLTEVAEALRKGNLKARSRIAGAGELATLGQTFDRMAGELEQHTTNLQKLVEQRTEELGQANQRLVATMDELSLANAKLEELARTDALTGLWNKRYLIENLPFHVALARRGKRKLSFAMLDVDHFKLYNDTHGHPAGDEVLRILGRLLRERVRQTDIPCRYGGEEFSILLPDTDLDSAFLVCEEMRKKVQEHPFPHEETQPGGRLTVSIGVAELADDMAEPIALVTLADNGLYEAKQGGRNATRKRIQQATDT
jgi:diguanylate cyclase (GGDEF)-like protein